MIIADDHYPIPQVFQDEVFVSFITLPVSDRQKNPGMSPAPLTKSLETAKSSITGDSIRHFPESKDIPCHLSTRVLSEAN